MLERPEYQVWRTLNDRERRAKVLIGVIDDAPFAPKQNLENTGYRVSYLGDRQSISAVQNSHIVLCDLQGVGKALDPNKQGAFFIDEIRRNYPEKFVIAYTGGGMNLNISRDALRSADSFMRKDANMDEWRDKLDEMIVALLDPYKVWQRQRMALVGKGIDTLSILQIEDAYVSSVKNKQPADSSNFVRRINSSSTSGDVRAVLQSLVASGLYSILTGN
jgi:hypothetical protein